MCCVFPGACCGKSLRKGCLIHSIANIIILIIFILIMAHKLTSGLDEKDREYGVSINVYYIIMVLLVVFIVGALLLLIGIFTRNKALVITALVINYVQVASYIASLSQIYLGCKLSYLYRYCDIFVLCNGNETWT
ncbi:uncharacterized protein LOC115620557 [Scaptodrosophila lebanonensis]|uniref:Uncharacterized protein LOC115620557 n=1 Tax=Drosophila lebanonensis TaxID=7225 RepID=A0A6J2T124_DROLE|nr:uncharacterized protein LOC115620557 [Scaptodrosophila lebanonensis]